MIPLLYPEINPSLRVIEGKKQVFCISRKRWVALTPEEWVRQNFLLYLVHQKKYPASLISVERISGGEVPGRFDIVIYKNSRPYMLVECKEGNVQLSENVISQVLSYNIPVKASIIVITNGNSCYAWSVENGDFNELDQIPQW